MNDNLEARPTISDIEPYQQGKTKLGNQTSPIKLSSNESALGCSDAARKAFIDCQETLYRYPDDSQIELRAAIAEIHHLPVEQIVCGNGSEELIGLINRAYVREEDEVILTENHFVMCPIYAKGQGAKVVLAAEHDDTIDVDAILSAITNRTRLICIANPNNPTGTYVADTHIRKLVENVPDRILVVLDGAYAEYVEASDYDAGADYVLRFQNVVMTRTLSKIYGLAGLRIGWAYAPQAVLTNINKLRTPFNANSAAMAAATAALRDQDFVARARSHNKDALAMLLPAIRDMGFRVAPSVANFYLIDLSTVAGGNAENAIALLKQQGIIPRPAAADKHLRITVGTKQENQAVLDVLDSYRKSLG